MLENFFNINLPYGIERNGKGEWTVFNREYIPLGFNNLSKEKIATLKNTKKFFVFTKYKRLTDNILMDLSFDGERGIRRDKLGAIERVYFYNDGSNPVRFNKPELWDRYFGKIKKLSRLKAA